MDKRCDGHLGQPSKPKNSNKMGKKDKFIRPGEEDEEYNAEADEEYAAVMAMRQEKSQTSTINLDVDNKSNYNKQALAQSLDSMTTSHLPFKESFQLCEYELPATEENDDLAREVGYCVLSCPIAACIDQLNTCFKMAFYEHSLQAVKSGRKQLSSLGIPHIRPKDYFCEHVKSDEHMGRVRTHVHIPSPLVFSLLWLIF
jgi:hypothetical protein